MNRSIRWIGALLLLAAPLVAQTLPPGKWWHRPEVVQRLSLSGEQRQRLDGVLESAAPELIELKAEADRQALALREQLDRPVLDREAVRQAAESVSSARARLFERELMMLVEMRGVLSEQQWNRFRTLIESRPGQGPPERAIGQRPRGTGPGAGVGGGAQRRSGRRP